MLTIHRHNAPMTKKRSKALWVVAALLVVNAVLLAAQPGLALPRSLGNYFFGPKLVRAEVVLREGNTIHDYRIDRGVIRAKTRRRAPAARARRQHRLDRGLAGRIDHPGRAAHIVLRVAPEHDRDRDSRR